MSGAAEEIVNAFPPPHTAAAFRHGSQGLRRRCAPLRPGMTNGGAVSEPSAGKRKSVVTMAAIRLGAIVRQIGHGDLDSEILGVSDMPGCGILLLRLHGRCLN